MYELIIHLGFAAAHNLRGYQGRCENLHGHNWKITVKVAAPRLDDLGMVMDFKELKAQCNSLLEELDHKYLNEIAPFDRQNPTTENIARHLYSRLSETLPDPVRVTEVTAWESDNCAATYRKDHG